VTELVQQFNTFENGIFSLVSFIHAAASPSSAVQIIWCIYAVMVAAYVGLWSLNPTAIDISLFVVWLFLLWLLSVLCFATPGICRTSGVLGIHALHVTMMHCMALFFSLKYQGFYLSYIFEILREFLIGECACWIIFRILLC